MRKASITPPPIRDVSIRRLATTSDWQTLGDKANLQFCVWIVADPLVLSVFAAPFAGSTSQYNPYSTSSAGWTITSSGEYSYYIEEIAVAQWLTPQTPARLHGDGTLSAISYPTHVGAVVRVYEQGGAVLRLYIKSLSVDLTNSAGSPKWKEDITITALNLPSNATTVSLGHAYVGDSKTSTFYLAYNYVGTVNKGCGIVSVTSTQVVNYFVLPTLSALISAAFMPIQNGVQIYMIFTQQSAVVKIIRLVSGSIVGEMMDELYFPGSSAPRNLLIFGSTFFAALVETPVLNAASGQAILHPNGPPLVIKVADNVQRTFTGVQGMPNGSRPTRIAAPIPMGNGELMWVTANGPDIFSIMSTQCLPDPSAPNVPRYWDGGQCLAHVCVRARLCPGTGQTWDSSLMRCVCQNGYFSTTSPLVCALCTLGSYCGNGTKYKCPNGMTTYGGGSVSASECSCKDSQFFANMVSCENCKAGQWCPNRMDSVTCPGNFDAARSNQLAEMYPKSCVCAAGYTGVACIACPVGFFCPASSSTAVNWVTMGHITPVDPSIIMPSTTDFACTILLPIFKLFLSGSKINYILDDRRILCKQYVPNGMVLMVQTEKSDVDNNILNELPKFLMYNATQAYTSQMGNFVFDGILPSTLQPSKNVAVSVNVPVACPSGKSPSDDRTACACSAGFEGTNCIACTANRYKANAGGGVCLACPIGFYSGVGSSACVAGSSNTQSDSGGGNQDSSNNNTPIIIGASVGGGVAALLIGWGIFAATTANSAASYSPVLDAGIV